MRSVAPSPGPRAEMMAVAGALLRKLRMDAGLTMPPVAEAARISVQKLSKIERGEVEIELFEFLAITKAVGASPVEALVALQKARS